MQKVALHSFVAEHRTLDSSVFAQNLLAAVKRFGDDRPVEDDATLVVAKFAGLRKTSA
jgi:serine phosphatase RsbU (regulator of sigma subunit)